MSHLRCCLTTIIIVRALGPLYIGKSSAPSHKQVVSLPLLSNKKIVGALCPARHTVFIQGKTNLTSRNISLDSKEGAPKLLKDTFTGMVHTSLTVLA